MRTNYKDATSDFHPSVCSVVLLLSENMVEFGIGAVYDGSRYEGCCHYDSSRQVNGNRRESCQWIGIVAVSIGRWFRKGNDSFSRCCDKPGTIEAMRSRGEGGEVGVMRQLQVIFRRSGDIAAVVTCDFYVDGLPGIADGGEGMGRLLVEHAADGRAFLYPSSPAQDSLSIVFITNLPYRMQGALYKCSSLNDECSSGCVLVYCTYAVAE